MTMERAGGPSAGPEADEPEGTRRLVDLFFGRLAAQDADGIQSLFAEHIDWFVPGDGRLPWTGVRSFRAQVGEYFRTLWPALQADESSVVVDAVLVDGGEAVVFSLFKHMAASTGRRFQTPTALRITVSVGEIVRLHLYEDTAAVRDAFFD